MFFSHRENTVGTLRHLVLILWLFVMLIINSSYTASLALILTIQQLSSGIEGIDSLISSNDPIEVQDGTFAYIFELVLGRFWMVDIAFVSLERRKQDFLKKLQLPLYFASKLDSKSIILFSLIVV